MTTDQLARRHLRFGWTALLVFASAGIALEALHAFKVSWYLHVGEETRRLLWRLGHAHGAFLALVNLGFAATVPRARIGRATTIASPCLLGATIAIPGGFLLGGITTHGGDPGAGIAVLPIGAALLLGAIAMTAWSLRGGATE